MKTFCYQVHSKSGNQKLVGGMLHAENMDDAAERAAHACRLQIQISGSEIFPRYDFVREGVSVYLRISAHADNLLTCGVPINDTRKEEEA